MSSVRCRLLRVPRSTRISLIIVSRIVALIVVRNPFPAFFVGLMIGVVLTLIVVMSVKYGCRKENNPPDLI